MLSHVFVYSKKFILIDDYEACPNGELGISENERVLTTNILSYKLYREQYSLKNTRAGRVLVTVALKF